MLSLLVKDKDLLVKDIARAELLKIVQFFNSDNSCQYKYAMGTDKPVTIEDLNEKYLEVLINAQEFFLSINYSGNFIGFIKGRADFRDKGEIWIMSILIDAPYQNKGIGKKALKLVMEEIKERFGVTSFYSCLVEDNSGGKKFWESNGFCEIRTNKNYFTIDNKNYDLVIMYRKLCGGY